MKSNTVRIIAVALIVVAGTIFSNAAFAQKEKYTVMVYPIDGDSMLIDEFKVKRQLGPGWESVDYFSAKWRGSRVKLHLNKIKTIDIIKPKKYETQVDFIDGRSDTFTLDIHELSGRSQYGPWEMNIIKVSKLDFTPDIKSQPGEAFDAIEGDAFDQVLLKNGDVITGTITPEVFQLETSYATIDLETPNIGFIDFEIRGQNKDMVILKMGDQLRGTIMVPIIRLKMRTGTEVALDTEQIEAIKFRK